MVVKCNPGHVHCDSCKGIGTLLGLGNMKTKCSVCHGVGWVKHITDAEEDAMLNQHATVKDIEESDSYAEPLHIQQPKKRGRKAKVIAGY